MLFRGTGGSESRGMKKRHGDFCAEVGAAACVPVYMGSGHAGLSNLLVSLGHTIRRRVVLGHALNTQTLTKTDEQEKGYKYTYEFVLGRIIAILGCMRSAGHGTDTPGSWQSAVEERDADRADRPELVPSARLCCSVRAAVEKTVHSDREISLKENYLKPTELVKKVGEASY